MLFRGGKYAALLLAAVASVCILQGVLRERGRASLLDMDTCESPEFRAQSLPRELYEEILEKTEKTGDFGRLLTAVMLNGRFYPKGDFSREGLWESRVYRKYKKEAFELLQKCYEAVWGDLKFFPVAGDGITYEDGWMDPRDFGGKRVHEGCDLFGPVETPGYYPVISMTDGVVEKIGWLPLGGYRIGIRAPKGGYFYYAHLWEYEKDFSPGEAVKAGDILGYMGNTGYGEEGTWGRFPVHLHLGIYLQTPFRSEMSVNPYWVLRALEKKRRNYTY